MAYTPEPWVQHDADYCPDEIWGALDYVDNGVRGQLVCTLADNDRLEANARRIVAAVNACAGIPTDALEAGAVADLLAACESIRPWLHGFTTDDGTPDGVSVFDLLDVLEAAIAKARKLEE